MTPSFLRALLSPEVCTVLLAGCGGGFDFVHALLLWDLLRRSDKRLVLVSYSFGDPADLTGTAEVVFDEDGALVKRIDASTLHPEGYAPEVHVATFLDGAYPEDAPHQVHACNGRSFTPDLLRRFYRLLIARHGIDAVVLVDGGTDSLMVGDEAGLGDPVEDAISVQAVAGLQEVPLRLLVSVGMGVDRFNGVSDAASLRAVSELIRAGAFRGGLVVEKSDPGYTLYRDALAWIERHQSFRSLVSRAVRSAIEGEYGSDPARQEADGVPEGLFVWPLMGALWAFDVEAVAHRSVLGRRLAGAPTVEACYAALRELRSELGARRRGPEHLPAARPWPLGALYDRPASPE